MKLAQRMIGIGTETAFEAAAKGRALEAQGRHIVHLEIGEPDFDTPAHVTEAAIAALKSGATHYGPAAGLPELRQAIAEDSTARRGAKATPEMVVVTPGGKPIMFYLILALVDPGDEVLYPNPGFPIYESMIRYIGGVPVPVRLLGEQGFALDVRVAPDLPDVAMDAEALKQALSNLLDNAMKYSADRRCIRVEARREGAGVAVEVADQGIGIPVSERERIFEKFYRIGRSETQGRRGSGVGLALVKHIVQAHGGRVTVDGAPGEGSRFTLHLPPGG